MAEASGKGYYPGNDRALMHELGRNDGAVGERRRKARAAGSTKRNNRQEVNMAVQPFGDPVSKSDSVLTAMGRANTDAQTPVAR